MTFYAEIHTQAFEYACSLGREKCGYAQDEDECAADKAGPCREEVERKQQRAQAAVLDSPDYARDMAHDGSETW